ncbi:hypothetical protein N7495_007971 [Penicillium taxi]|uniref:uncharacterized protein n=1 Tax=Penicillium taxi TaxID=168475 RepID=UPI0025452257|nr:uncharacterized protein N7495_007971 [Penicillium taxi]KAJ5887930.1 hypothetical protein N7495_007971 [Penicillium taxi]
MEQVPSADIDKVFAHTTNLASCNLNTKVLACSNDFFASADNLLTPTPAISRPGVFIHTGAWYDGWETRRHNQDPYDWVVIKLGVTGSIQGVEVDTAFFTGNYGEKAELQAIYAPEGSGITDDQIASPSFNGWNTVLPVSECGPSQRRAWKIPYDAQNPAPYTHVRLLMYPDGGFARLRLYGHAVPPPPPNTQSDTVEELSSALMGGLVLDASDQHYTPASNIILPGRGKDMGDGWETARSRGAGHVDWAIIQLGVPGSVSNVVVDTKDFRGNFPHAVRVHGLVAGNGAPTFENPGWVEIIKGDKSCQADTEHTFDAENSQVFTYVKLTLVPDGGVKRFRVFGRRA